MCVCPSRAGLGEAHKPKKTGGILKSIICVWGKARKNVSGSFIILFSMANGNARQQAIGLLLWVRLDLEIKKYITSYEYKTKKSYIHASHTIYRY